MEYEFKDILMTIVTATVVIVVISTYLSYFKIFKTEKNPLRQFDFEVEKIKTSLTPEIDISADSNERQFLLLKEYHAQSLAQSKISFWFSLVSASVGFIIIILAIVTIDKNLKLYEQTNSIVALISGIVIDAVSALFFVQSNKSRELMAAFFDKLRADRKIEEALKLS